MMPSSSSPKLTKAIMLAAMAGGLGWGIRGQYGHETGAMIAGLLVASTLIMLFTPTMPALAAARAIALATIAIAWGGSMTYGQTIGLTQDAPLVGNWAALGWGLLGLLIKGAIWIGPAGLFLGMSLGGKRYQPVEWLLLLCGMVVLLLVGIQVFNEPFDPAQRVLPRVYFSDSWEWEPDADLRPRREQWGGLLLAWLGATSYVRWVRRDYLAFRLSCWGAVGGGLGFPLGQCLQAFHAWNIGMFRQGIWASLDPYINWWNMMETAFGAIFGAILALGLWSHQHLIRWVHDEPKILLGHRAEWISCGFYAVLLVVTEFGPDNRWAWLIDMALPLGVIPVLAVATGRFWPVWLCLPITLLPIAIKTVLQLSYEAKACPPAMGWILFALVPLALVSLMAYTLARPRPFGQSHSAVAAKVLLIATWVYFGLNFAIFRFPWPWEPWTQRTPNAMIFFTCALGLTLAALRSLRSRPAPNPDFAPPGEISA